MEACVEKRDQVARRDLKPNYEKWGKELAIWSRQKKGPCDPRERNPSRERKRKPMDYVSFKVGTKRLTSSVSKEMHFSSF